MTIPHIHDFAVPAELQHILAISAEKLAIQTALHTSLWQLDQADWLLSQEEGALTFIAPNGMTVICTAQIIGTYNTEDYTWLWAWDHPSIAEPLRQSAHAVRAYGVAHALAQLTTRKLICTEQHAWEFTALAAHLCNAQGGYCGAAGATLVFVVYDHVRLGQTNVDS